MAQQEGMTDQQVEELVHALLDFRNMLVSLTDRFQNRLALLEQEFADYRNAPEQSAEGAPVQSIRNTSGTAPLEMPNLPDPADPSGLTDPPDFLEDDDAFAPEDTDAFSIVDIDDDDF